MSAAKADVHIRALRRLIQTVSNYQLEDLYFMVGEENLRRQALAEASKSDPDQSP